MEPFTTLTAIAAPLDMNNVDTDQILPARYLRRPRDERYPTYGFHDQRFDAEGKRRDDFILNQPPFDAAGILVAARNFGVGSSREAAVYALLAMGYRCVVAESFGDIFHSNALKNGLLPVALPAATCTALRAALLAAPGAQITVDLTAQILTAPDGGTHAFTVPPFARDCLLRGLDEIGLTLTLADAIAAFESRRDQGARGGHTASP
jgi:3-isopropylmalate/(R)-2-methylmalate dehydratase small subunit